MVVTEVTPGKTNQFLINPHKANGKPLTDIDAASGFAGHDVYFTELWTSDVTVVDGTEVRARSHVIYVIGDLLDVR